MTCRIFALLVAIVAVLTLSGAPPTDAGTNLVPTKSTDSADGDCDPSADCSLREAIIEANATPGPQIIDLGSGTYELTLNGTDDNASLIGDLDVTDDLSIRGAGSDDTVISQDAVGRVMEIFGPARVNLIGLTITNGKSGGLHNSPDAVLYMQDVVIAGNHGNGFVGGMNNQGFATLVNVKVTDNQTSAASGGIFNNGHIYIRSSLIARNTAHVAAGGMRNIGTATLENTTVSGNIVIGDVQRGGGLYSEGGWHYLRNVTVTGNTAGTEGGGIYAGSSGWSIVNTIIANNDSDSGPDCFTATGVSIHSDGGNLIPVTEHCELIGNTSADIYGDNALLGPLAENGGFSATHALLDGSPAIDGGLLSRCPPQDQRAVLRPQGDGCDIGAFELGGVVPDYVWGDFNCDRRVDARDGYHLLLSEADLIVAPIAAGCPALGQTYGPSTQGDVNCANGIDTTDVIAVLTFAAHVPHPEAPSTCPDVGDIVPG